MKVDNSPDQGTEVQPQVYLQTQQNWKFNIWTFVRKQPLGAAGGLSLLILVLTAIFAPLIQTFDPLLQDVPNRLHPPDSRFLFGTDSFGRDMFSRIVHGARVSLYVGLFSVTIGTAAGTLTGVTSAYAGGKVDLFVQRIVDAMQGIPGLILILALVVALGSSLNNVTLAIAVAFTPRMVRLSRSQALMVKQEDYVLAAKSIGSSPVRVILRHVLTNSMTPVIVLATGYLGTAIVTEAGLSFLGLGVPPPHPSWGGMLQFGARQYQEAAPWLTIFPGIALTITVFGFNLFGDALRDALDPQLRGH